MTEEEAKTKWCPHAVASHTNPRGTTEFDDGEQLETPRFVHNCIGSACMAWRWELSLGGYCGLAGKP